MDWSTVVGLGVPVTVIGLAALFAIRWGANANDDRVLARTAQLDQAAQMHEAERQRDASTVRATKAEGDLDLANAANQKLHAVITGLIATNTDALKEKINAAEGDDLIAAARAVLGVPQLSNMPRSGGAGGAAAGGGAAPAAAVRDAKGA